MKYINITPTWRELLPALVQVAANGETAEARKTAMDELYRLADAADNINAKGFVMAKDSEAREFKCPLCGQVVTDGKPCGCGAR